MMGVQAMPRVQINSQATISYGQVQQVAALLTVKAATQR